MHPAYFETRFRTAVAVSHWPDQFVILTAHATTGEVWSAERCAQADAALHQRLVEQCGWLVRLTGYSPITGHAEAGWGCDLDLATGCEVGRQFLQDALYVVDRGGLFVCQCAQPADVVWVAPFFDRLD
jgi:hypothetical protein